MKGCPDCGSKYFKYYSETKKEKVKPPKGKSIENVMVKQRGIYEVNLGSLLEDDSIIVSDQEGKYVIDINTLLKQKDKDKKRNR